MKEEILIVLKKVFGAGVFIELSVVEDDHFGHYSTNMAFRLAKEAGKSPFEVAKEYAAEINIATPAGFFQKIEAAPPGFINFWLSNEVLQKELENVSRNKKYGESSIGKKKTIIVEYSAPNIAKLMHVGHLRNTIIGDSLSNILEAQGYKVVRWNYLGDWGTQFGKIIAAYKLWGKKEDFAHEPIEMMQALYVRFHDEATTNPELEKRGQEEFKKLENGDKENQKLWKWFREESIRELKKAYVTLGISDFDVWIGESFFEGEMKSLVKELLDNGVAVRSEGAIVINLDDAHLPVALVQKSDGASLYLTRDIANLRYRLKEYKPAKILIVSANEQSLHFEQLFAIAQLLGLESAELKHIKYGLVLGTGGKKLSTRKGTTQLLSEVVNEAVVKAREVIEEKTPDISDKEKTKVAFTVALGALKYNDLKENRTTDIIFDWDKMLSFSGDSGPYLQYTYARLQSILRKAGKVGKYDFAQLDRTDELVLMRKIFEFPEIVERAGELYSTSTLATYLYKLAVAANKFYETTPILKDENVARLNARLVLIETAARTLKNGLGLLGIETLEKI
jgi:arginyl-tRNA synthetase